MISKSMPTSTIWIKYEILFYHFLRLTLFICPWLFSSFVKKKKPRKVFYLFLRTVARVNRVNFESMKIKNKKNKKYKFL
jgi:hypothetical protein